MNYNFDFREEFTNIGLNISYYRKKKGLTQLNLAELVDISRSHLSNIEATGKQTSISIETLLKICKVLDVEPGKLFESR